MVVLKFGFRGALLQYIVILLLVASWIELLRFLENTFDSVRIFLRLHSFVIPCRHLPLGSITSFRIITNKNAFLNQRPTSCLPIEHLQYDLRMTFTLKWPWPYTCKTRLNWCADGQINIYNNDFDLNQWPWYSNLTQICSRWTIIQKNEVSRSTHSKVIAETDRQKHR